MRPPEVPETIQTIFAKRPDCWPDRIKPGLQRIQRAWDALDRPAKDIPTILVAGTNGKGTTAGYIWQMLTAAEMRAGLYTSPHLISFAERFHMSHARVTEGELVAEVEDLQRDLPTPLWEAMSFFEVATLLALRLFARQKVDVMILEVGLGGRWDATNIVDPVVAVITSIGRDHQRFLGNDLAQIAMEKAGIMRPGIPVVWGGQPNADPAADAEIRRQASHVQAPLFEPNHHQGCLDRTIDHKICDRHDHYSLQRLAPHVEESSITSSILEELRPSLFAKKLCHSHPSSGKVF